jgi:hypothetical protein
MGLCEGKIAAMVTFILDALCPSVKVTSEKQALSIIHHALRLKGDSRK